MEVINRFSQKLDISKEEYKEVMKKTNKYPIEPPASSVLRLERLFDLFKIIFADHDIDDEELKLIKRYAIGLGYSEKKAKKVIARSINIFRGKLDFEDYLYLVKK